jgi:hypothetical protein
MSSAPRQESPENGSLVRSSESLDWYQRPTSNRTVTIFGESENGVVKHVERILYDHEAYEAAQGYVYLSELATYYSDRKKVVWAEFPCLCAFLAQIGRAEFCELGSTVFSSIEKLQGAENALKLGMIQEQVDFIGIELSRYFREIAALIRRPPIRQFATFGDVPKPAQPRVTYSHFVGNYAFASTMEYLKWLGESSAAVIAETFSLTGQDMEISGLGKHVLLFGFTEFCDGLREFGFVVLPYHFRRVNLWGSDGVQVYMLLHKAGVVGPQEMLRNLGFDVSLFYPEPTRDVIFKRFGQAAGANAEAPGGSGFRRL